jgi:rhodanese-related sulfurtransferase
MRLSPADLRFVIALRFRGVRWVRSPDLAAWMAAEEKPLLLLDAREEEEFAVSHLAGARRVDPGSGRLDPRDVPVGARVVVYCSVGYRSASVALRVAEAGFERVYNLEGGIFQWANEGRSLHRGSEAVREVHPFDRFWGRLLDARFHPGR